MISTNEHLHSPETSIREESRVELPETRMARTLAEKSCALREATLSSIQTDIGSTLYEALVTKLRYERASLFEHIEADAGSAEKRSRVVLKNEYFIQKPLDIDIF